MNTNSFTQGIINIVIILICLVGILFIGAVVLTKFQAKQILDGFLLVLGIVISARLFYRLRK